VAKPGTASIKEKIRETVKTNKTVKTQALTKKLNPVIRGRGNYFRHSAGKRTFTGIDHAVFEMTWKRAKRRHPGKSLIYRTCHETPKAKHKNMPGYSVDRTERSLSGMSDRTRRRGGMAHTPPETKK
jgi:hypothetical protein